MPRAAPERRIERWAWPGDESEIDPEPVRSCLGRVLASRAFSTSPKLACFLGFVVEARLAGQADRLKAYTVGVEVFDRRRDFDPAVDSIVRVNAIRLRGLLRHYYAYEGRGDPLRILLPKGRYVPEFSLPQGECLEATHEGTKEGARECAREQAKHPNPILLVVEPLSLIGGPPGQNELQASLAAGLTEELIAHLNGYGDGLVVVQVPARGGTGNLGQVVGSALGMAYRLHGILRQDADQVRIGFTLLEALRGRVTWSETFAFQLSSEGLFEIQEQVARQVASRILDPHGVLYRSLKRQPAALLGTYLAVFRYHEYQERFSPESHLRAREALEQAVREEPGYAEAWAALANIDVGETLFGFNRRLPLPELTDRCLDTAHRAVALDPRSVMAHYILAMILFYRKDKDRFLSEAEHALALAPKRPGNLAVIGMHLALAGQWERGLALVQEAMGLNPFHPPWYHLVFSLDHLHFGRHREALAAIGRFAALDFVPFQINLAVIHGHLGNATEAQKALRRMLALWPQAQERLHEIVGFWFPCENLATVLADGLRRAGLQLSGDWKNAETHSGLELGAS